MMEGTYYKEWSAVLDREMEFKVYGHGGVPVLALPARGGRFYDWENNGMPDAAAPSPLCTRTASATRMFCPRPRRTVCCSAWVRAAMRAMPSPTPRLWPTP